MTEAITIPAGGPARLLLFTLDLPREDIRFMATHHDRAGWLASMLGVATVNPAEVETFDLDDLGSLGIAGYLIEAHGLSAEVLAPDLDRLAALKGPVMILRTVAFGGRAVRLQPRPVMALAGAWSEEPPPLVRFDPLPDGGAKGARAAPTGKPRMSDARMGGMVAMGALAVMFALTAVVIWIGG
jgi:hypothetical protein